MDGIEYTIHGITRYFQRVRPHEYCKLLDMFSRAGVEMNENNLAVWVKVNKTKYESLKQILK